MADSSVKVNVKKFMANPLLGRKQMLIEVIHPGLPNVSKEKLKAVLAERYKVDNTQTVVLFGYRTAFGGGRSKGFALIYNSMEEFQRFEPKYRKVRMGLLEDKKTSRKAMKELKNRKKKTRGTKKADVGGGAKK